MILNCDNGVYIKMSTGVFDQAAITGLYLFDIKWARPCYNKQQHYQLPSLWLTDKTIRDNDIIIMLVLIIVLIVVIVNNGNNYIIKLK